MAVSSRWLNDTFPGWAKLRTAEKKAIRDFPVMWAHFELHATNTQANPASIIAAVNQLAVVPALVVVSEANTYFADRYYRGGRPTHHLRHLRLTMRAKQVVEPVLLQREQSNSEKLKTALLIINRLRNNFLHDEKARYSFDDQFENFKHANAVLVAAIPLWLPNQE